VSARWGALLLALLLVPTGCAAGSAPDAESVVARFYAAYGRHDGTAACALLAPAARKEVSDAAHGSCARGLLRETLHGSGLVRSSQVYGDQAQVHVRGDTAFVARIDGRWQVRAVGCASRQDAPYECEVEDGG
jgi:hypothetical protein